MALHELVIDGVSSANFGAYVFGGGTWKTPKRKGSVVNVAGRNGALWIDDGAWDDVTIRYDVMFNGNNSEKFDAFTTWLASMSMGQHRIEDTLHERYYRIGRVNCSVSPKTFEKWNVSKFSVDIVCRPEKFLKSAEEPAVWGPMSTCYLVQEGALEYAFTQDATATGATFAKCSALMYYIKKAGPDIPQYLDIFIDGIKAEDQCYISFESGSVGQAQPGETCRFTNELGMPAGQDSLGYIHHDITTWASYDWVSYRLAVVQADDSIPLTMRIEQGENFVAFYDYPHMAGLGETCQLAFYSTESPFVANPLIRVRGWSFHISVEGVDIQAEDYRTVLGYTPGSDAWKFAPPVDFYIDSQTKEIYYKQLNSSDVIDYTEHITMSGYKFPTISNGGNVIIYPKEYSGGVTDYPICSVSLKPRWYQI